MFVGRALETSALSERLAAAAAGDPQFVLVEGVAGIGKTALVDRFVSLHRDGVTLLRARADEAERAAPFSLVGRLLARAGARADGLLPTLAGQAVDLDPLVAGAGLLELLGTMQSGLAPVVVVVDDVHLADSSSTAALVLAARRLLADRVMLLLTARSGPLDDSWERLVSAQGGSRIALGGLSAAELRSLGASLGTNLTETEAGRLAEETDGHPLYARALLTTGAFLGDAALPLSAPPPPPAALSAIVVRQLSACSEQARALVAAVAVLGRSSTLGEATELAGLVDASGAIEEAVAAGILSEPGRPVLELRFTHALVRAACYQSLGAARLVELHLRAAALTTGDRRLQHRLAACRGSDEGLAAELEATARSLAGAGALVAAGERLRQAAEVSPPGPIADRRLLEAVETWLIAGEASRAFKLEQRVRALGDSPYRDHVVAYLGLVAGRLPEAEAGFRRAWSQVVRGEAGLAPADIAGRIAVCMAILVVIDLNVEEMLAWGEAARVHAAADPASASFGWFCAALAMGTLGRGEEALKLLRSPGVPDTADVLAARGMLEMWTDDLASAREDLGMAFARSRAGDTVRVTQALGFLAECEQRLGLFDEASVHAELAVDSATEAGRVWDLPLLHSLATYPAAARGDFEIAEAHAKQAADWAALIPIAAFRAYASAAAAALATARGDPVEVLGPARSLDSAYRLADPGVVSFGPLAAEALVRLGRLDEADEALAGAEARAERLGRRSALLGAARVRGMLEAARGDRGAAEKAFAEAARLAERLDLPLERARLEEAWGGFLLSCGKLEAGRSRLEAALTGFERLGAHPYAAAVRARLAEVAAIGPAAPGVHLSAAEAMVARLVGSGLSNKEIAAQLVISVKAVEYHLTNIYRRLGVSSRVKLAQLVTARGPGSPTPS